MKEVYLTQKATRIELLFSDSWEKHQYGRNLFMIPKYMFAPVQDPSLESYQNLGFPFINVVRDEENTIIEAELSPGLVRSMPIFYALHDDVLYVSDFPEPIGNKLKLKTIDMLSVLELISFGFVNSDRTVVKELYSLQAGDVLLFKAGETKVKTEYLYDNIPLAEGGYKELRSELKRVSEEMFHDFVVSLKGKTPVLSLSGGYDSRFIASMLKMNGVKDVICLSYGIPDNPDTEKSEEVAKRLGYEWHYFPSSTERWDEIFHKDLFLEFVNFSSRYTAIPHYQEMLPLLELDESFANGEFVFMTGYSGDFISGGHNLGPSIRNFEDLVDTVLKRHYVFRLPPVNESVRDSVREQCREYLEVEEHFFRVFEMWEWRERMAKFTANGIRNYEFFDHCWCLPLWDKRFTDFWSKVPLKWKFAQRLYDEFLEEDIFEKLNIDFDRRFRKKERRSRFRAVIVKHERLHAVARKLAMSLRKKGMMHFVHLPNSVALKTSNPILLDIASSWSEFSTVESICRQEFHGYREHPNSCIPEFYLSYLLSEGGLSTGESS